MGLSAPSVLAAAAAVVAAAGMADAMPSYRFEIPNGERVPCPEEVGGCLPGAHEMASVNGPMPEWVCKGVGHATCEGGSFPLNPFGFDFWMEGFKWTEALCMKDSDGDGLTNGEELGDPCCVWEKASFPLPSFQWHDVSHPGYASSRTLTPPPKNCNGVEGLKPALMDSTPKDFFNEGETRFFKDLYIDNYTVPTDRTTYVDFAIHAEFPECETQACYLVAIEALVDRKDLVHHYILDACPEGIPEEHRGQEVGKFGASNMVNCNMAIGGWAPGKDPLWFAPGYAGRAFGKDEYLQINGVLFQMHYDNPYGLVGATDSSGIRIHFTTTPRQYALGSLAAHRYSFDWSKKIPAGHERHVLTTMCEISGAEEPLHIVRSNFHAHLLGSEMQTTLIRNGKKSTIYSESTWHFDDQYDRNLEGRNLTLHNGDVLMSTCVFNSTGRTSDTTISISTFDEMCWATLTYYPAQWRTRCNKIDSEWMADLPAEAPLQEVYTHTRPSTLMQTPEESMGLQSDGPAWTTPVLGTMSGVGLVPEEHLLTNCSSLTDSKTCASHKVCMFRNGKCLSRDRPALCSSATSKKVCNGLSGCMFKKGQCVVGVDCRAAKQAKTCSVRKGCAFYRKKCVEKASLPCEYGNGNRKRCEQVIDGCVFENKGRQCVEDYSSKSCKGLRANPCKEARGCAYVKGKCVDALHESACEKLNEKDCHDFDGCTLTPTGICVSDVQDFCESLNGSKSCKKDGRGICSFKKKSKLCKQK